MLNKAFTVMDRVPGYTLNELTYKKPDVLEENKIKIAFQLGMHTVFSYVFGVRDGYQTNYIFDPTTKILTRIDKERFLEVPENPFDLNDPSHPYNREIALCELSNLKYVPSFRQTSADKSDVIKALKAGFMEKYSEVKKKKKELLDLVWETRETWWELRPGQDKREYDEETKDLADKIDYLIEQEPEKVWNTLVKAKIHADKK